jgi:dihydroorotase
LYFSSHEITAENKSFKMNPPLRGPEDRSALQNALVEGRVDWMATDHAPHESDTKTKEFSQASFGTVGLETSLQTMLWMNQKHQMSPQRFVETWSLLPARFLGIEKEFGEIEVGKALRAVLVDLNSDMPVVGENFWGLSKNTCFEGVKLPGRVLAHATRAGWFEF